MVYVEFAFWYIYTRVVRVSETFGMVVVLVGVYYWLYPLMDDCQIVTLAIHKIGEKKKNTIECNIGND